MSYARNCWAPHPAVSTSIRDEERRRSFGLRIGLCFCVAALIAGVLSYMFAGGVEYRIYFGLAIVVLGVVELLQLRRNAGPYFWKFRGTLLIQLGCLLAATSVIVAAKRDHANAIFDKHGEFVKFIDTRTGGFAWPTDTLRRQSLQKFQHPFQIQLGPIDFTGTVVWKVKEREAGSLLQKHPAGVGNKWLQSILEQESREHAHAEFYGQIKLDPGAAEFGQRFEQRLNERLAAEHVQLEELAIAIKDKAAAETPD